MIACPLPGELLADYFARALGRDEADQIDAHVFECDRCAQLYEAAGALPAALHRMIAPVISPERLAALLASGAGVRAVPVAPGVPAVVEFTPGIDFLIFRLQADLAGASRVDVETSDAEIGPLLAIEGVPWDAERGEVLVACQRHYMTGNARFVMRVRVYAEIAGTRREVGEYVVDHRVVDA
jgi:hypothetical protein